MLVVEHYVFNDIPEWLYTYAAQLLLTYAVPQDASNALRTTSTLTPIYSRPKQHPKAWALLAARGIMCTAAAIPAVDVSGARSTSQNVGGSLTNEVAT